MTTRTPRRLLAVTIILAATGLALSACVTPPRVPTPTPLAPGAPTGLAVGPCNGGLQAISWSPPASNGSAAITSYQVSHATGAPIYTGLGVPPAFACGDNSALYKVAACSAVGCGAATALVGYVPPTAAAGNGIVEPGEQCDDGNTVSGDGCSATALIEPYFTCVGSPSVCTHSIMGNGIVEPGEECDDGNTVSGDGCSATGQIEP